MVKALVKEGKLGGQTSPTGGHTGGAYGRLTKVEFPKFDGEEVLSWLYRVNNYFEMDHIVENEQKIRLVSMHLFGKALNWHKHFMSKFGEVMTWDVYQTHVKKRFESVFEDPVVELKNLKQTTTVQGYQDFFEELLNKVDINEPYSVSLFIGGLKEEIAYSVGMFKPTSLSEVFSLSELQEASNSVTRSRHSAMPVVAKNTVFGTINNRGRGSGIRTVGAMSVQATTIVPNRHFKKLT
ncbi:reverse transcriptase [Tanacetum coccineum]